MPTARPPHSTQQRTHRRLQTTETQHRYNSNYDSAKEINEDRKGHNETHLPLLADLRRHDVKAAETIGLVRRAVVTGGYFEVFADDG